MEGVDWNELWKAHVQNSSLRKMHGDMIDLWTKKAVKYDDSVKKSDQAAKTISKLDIGPEDTVMDIGAGPGTLSIPLAKIVKHVTAVEPSTGMLSCLKKNAQEAGLRNISFLNKRWEEVKAFEDVEQHNVLIASYSLSMLDMKTALSKMNALSTKKVYLFSFAVARMWDYEELWPKLFNEQFIKGPDYSYLYNILHDMGIHANVLVTDFVYKQPFPSLDVATKHWMLNLNITSSDKEEIIRSHFSETLFKEDGVLWSKNKMKSAMIWWSKEYEN